MENYQATKSSESANGLNRYRWYVLAILAISYASSYMDRQILSILLEDIRLEFALSDTQLGLLSGLAFAVFYATLGIPIARIADRLNRVNIIAIAVSVWSGMTMLCGMASSFTQLFLARVGVGVGEAGGTAPAHSVISDYFNENERAFAISIYSLGIALGSLFGLVLGGVVAEFYGWRLAFVVAGLPGLGVALLLRFTVREPRRGAFSNNHNGKMIGDQERQSLITLFVNLWQLPAYKWVTIAHVLAVFVAYAISSWLPALYLREFELGQAAVGTIIGVTNLVGSVSGLLAGGYLADRLGKSDKSWLGFVPAVSLLIALPAVLIALILQDLYLSTIFFGISFFFYQASHAPGLAVVQLVASPETRSQAVAFVFFLTNLLGLGFGPLLVGYISDLGVGLPGLSPLAFAMGLVSCVLLLAAFSYRLVGIALAKDSGAQGSLQATS